jgi:sn-glycerol 3-phosphate transport system permease protein
VARADMVKNDWVAHLVLGLGVLLFALPIWLAFAGATQDPGAIARGDLSLIPNLSGFGVYRDVLLNGAPGVPPVWRMLLVSFAMAVTIAVLKIVLSLLSAYAVAFFRFPFRMTAFWIIFITLMLLVASATATLLFRQTFTIIPDELMEAARMDGAGPWRFLKDILIPVSGANIAALFVILFVYGWTQYLWPLIVATNPHLDTIVIGIVQMIGVDTQTQWNKVMATAMLALAPPIAVVVLMQHWFVKGLTEGEK